jgi:hypothetical protein
MPDGQEAALLLGVSKLGGDVLRVSGLLATQLSFAFKCFPSLASRAGRFVDSRSLALEVVLEVPDSLQCEGEFIAVIERLGQGRRLGLPGEAGSIRLAAVGGVAPLPRPPASSRDGHSATVADVATKRDDSFGPLVQVCGGLWV